MTLILWNEDNGPRAPQPGWWTTALAAASTPIRSTDGVQPLIPLTNPSGTDDTVVGYALADYLEQYLMDARRFHRIPDGHWNAFNINTCDAGTLIALADGANRFARFGHAENLFRKAAAAGDLTARRRLAAWLRGQPGREADAERAYRDAAEAGDPDALRELAVWLRGQPGWEAETERALRDVAEAGDR